MRSQTLQLLEVNLNHNQNSQSLSNLKFSQLLRKNQRYSLLLNKNQSSSQLHRVNQKCSQLHSQSLKLHLYALRNMLIKSFRKQQALMLSSTNRLMQCTTFPRIFLMN